MRILVETRHERCAPHMGSAKSGGNYASALHWQMQAVREHRAQQVLFCPGGDVQETGASNFILLDGKTLITKPLSSAFLHGITRHSVLTIAQTLGYEVVERDFTVDTLKTAVQNGAQAALTGTAAVIAPVSTLIFEDGEIDLQGQEQCLALRRAVLDVQYGRAPDDYHWLTRVTPA